MAKGMTKSEFVEAVAQKAGLDKKSVSAALEAIVSVTTEQLKAGSEVTLPGLVKLAAVHKPAVPEREGINPFTKQPVIFKAKPASTAVKARPAKALKDAVA